VTAFERRLRRRNPQLGGGREERAGRRATTVGRGAQPPSEYHLPLNWGSRFSTKARAASRWSSVMPVRV
jgi:hypothetical protein